MVAKCPFCGHGYLYSSHEIPKEIHTQYYQDHLNEGCNPTLGFTLGKVFQHMANAQKEFIA